MFYAAGPGTSVFEYILLGSVGAGLAAFILYSFWLILRAPEYSRVQKASQLFLVIAFPVLGALLVYAFVQLQRKQAQT